MPASYLIDPALHAVFMRGWGEVSDPELMGTLRALLADPRFDPTYGRILDLREVTTFAASGASIRHASAVMAEASPARRAIVVGSTVGYGLGRMSQLSADSPPEQSLLCRDLESAMTWLGLPHTTTWPSGPPDHAVEEPG